MLRLIRTRVDGCAQGGVVAIGNFDGLHYGHQTVIGIGRQIASTLGLSFTVVTFEPHPRAVLEPNGLPFRLTLLRSKARLLDRMGVNFCFLLRFDEALRRMSAAEFIQRILLDGLKTRFVVVGETFRFGSGRQGNIDLLRQRIESVTSVGGMKDRGGEVYSSSAVRRALRNGDVVGAKELLGRFWSVCGRVEKGDQRGRSFGFPTANIDLEAHVRPAFGVYLVSVEMRDGECYPGIANIGIRPTVSGRKERLEVHLFDYDRDLYGQVLQVHLVQFLRRESRFEGIEALKRQIRRDIEQAREILTTS